MTHLQPGDQAPSFKCKDQDGNQISLSDFKGKKLILYFYPKDNTPGCTTESCNLRDNHASLIKQGFAVVGVSADDEKSHQKFIKKYKLPFRLLADTDKSICRSYGVYGEKSFLGRKYMGIHRSTFLIDEKGVVEKVFTKVDVKNHARQITG